MNKTIELASIFNSVYVQVTFLLVNLRCAGQSQYFNQVNNEVMGTKRG